MAKLFYAIVFAALVCVCCEQSSTGRTLSVFEQRALEVGGKALKKDTVFCNGHLFVKSEPGAFNTTASEYTQASLSVESTPITEADRLNQQGLGWKGEVKYMCSSGAARDWADYRHSWSEWRNMGGGHTRLPGYYYVSNRKKRPLVW